MQRRDSTGRKRRGWIPSQGGKTVWTGTVSLLRSGSERSYFVFYINPCLAITFVGQPYLLESPKTALALLTSILSEGLIERHKYNSEKKQWDREGKKSSERERERESKPQRRKKGLEWKITLKPAHREAWQSQLGFCRHHRQQIRKQHSGLE